mmetsp:Transcript_26388/g.90763  ORF Transcript_26388/g.90763 Transcript_26388/m.90763 type:complete len:155 (-) Transcript_26388:5-469(-)
MPKATVANEPTRAFAAAAVARSFTGFDDLEPALAGLRRRLARAPPAHDRPDVDRPRLFEPSTLETSWRAFSHDDGRARGAPRAATPTLGVVANLNLAPAIADELRQRASLMLAARAYLHRYEALGVERDDLAASLDSVADVVQLYDEAARGASY